MPGNVFFQGSNIWAVEWMGTDSLCSVMIDAIALRGTEADMENIDKLCAVKKFWSAPAKAKRATLSHYFDIDRLFQGYDLATYPVKYLFGYVANNKIMRAF